jgi:hypothetical protein
LVSPGRPILQANSFSAGASGCVVAARLANTKQRLKVLLLEAGSNNGDIPYRVPADRFKTFQEATLNWGYKTVPQNHLKGQQIDYSRGKGLGGSTAINFSCCKSPFFFDHCFPFTYPSRGWPHHGVDFLQGTLPTIEAILICNPGL